MSENNVRDKNSSGSHQQTLLIQTRADEVKEEPRSYISASIREKANRKERKTNACMVIGRMMVPDRRPPIGRFQSQAGSGKISL